MISYIQLRLSVVMQKGEKIAIAALGVMLVILSCRKEPTALPPSPIVSPPEQPSVSTEPSKILVNLTFPSGFFTNVANERVMLARVNCPQADGTILGLKEGEQKFKPIPESPLNPTFSKAVCSRKATITATNNGRKANISLSVLSENPFWRYGVNSASEAAGLSQSAQTLKQWLTVKETWENAIALAQKVPQSDRNYATAQQKVQEWGQNRAVSQQKFWQIAQQKVPELF